MQMYALISVCPKKLRIFNVYIAFCRVSVDISGVSHLIFAFWILREPTSFNTFLLFEKLQDAP